MERPVVGCLLPARRLSKANLPLSAEMAAAAASTGSVSQILRGGIRFGARRCLSHSSGSVLLGWRLAATSAGRRRGRDGLDGRFVRPSVLSPDG